MQALLLVFLAAAWLGEAVLAVGLAPNAQARRASLSLGLATGVAVVLSALLASPDFLLAFCFLCVLLQLSSGRAHPTRLAAAAQKWRRALPLLSGNLAVLAHFFTAGPLAPGAMLSSSVGLTIALVLLVPVARAVLDRLQVSLVPAFMRGAPIVIVTAALAAIGLTGMVQGLPW